MELAIHIYNPKLLELNSSPPANASWTTQGLIKVPWLQLCGCQFAQSEPKFQRRQELTACHICRQHLCFANQHTFSIYVFVCVTFSSKGRYGIVSELPPLHTQFLGSREAADIWRCVCIILFSYAAFVASIDVLGAPDTARSLVWPRGLCRVDCRTQTFISTIKRQLCGCLC